MTEKAVYEASPIKRTRRTREEMEQLDAALYQIAQEVQPATVRQIFYQAEVRGLIPKDERGYDAVQRRLVELREKKLIPYEWITDNARLIRGLRRYSGPDGFARDVASLYRRDYWVSHPCRVEIWIEKDALASVLYPVVVEDWGLNLYVTRGFSSITYLQNAADDIQARRKKTFVYVLSDFDPSGISLAQKISEELQRRAAPIEVEVSRLAVTPAQIAKWCLPSRETKVTDSRAKKFMEQYGDRSVELDAIPPQELRRLVSESIEAHAGVAEMKRLQQMEALERQQFVNIMGQLRRH